jgi:hypothetical protein
MTKMGSTVKTKTEISSQGSFDQLRLKADATSLLKGQSMQGDHTTHFLLRVMILWIFFSPVFSVW